MHYLSVVGADRGEDGRYIISGEQVVSGMGGDELLVPDCTVYFVDRKPKSLAAGLSTTSQGVGGIKAYGGGNPYDEYRFVAKRQCNPVPEGQRKSVRKATKKFERDVASRLKGENVRVSILDSMPKYTVVVYVEHCPGTGDYDRRQGDVLAAFEDSGLAKHLYFDGTDYGPMPGPAATPADVKEMGCPERGYHFYDASATHPPGVDLGDEGYRQASAWERGCIDETLSRAADHNPADPGSQKNPQRSRHLNSYEAYLLSADRHLTAGLKLLDKGDRRRAFTPLRHAECDIRQAYTEAFYAKKDQRHLAYLSKRLEPIYVTLRGAMEQLEAQL